ncbi:MULTISPECIES: chemotaxis protein CheC [Oceanobacillus]|uniref:CheY-P-specific phosphatase CheC n=1 Tax=Oceanobacillus kimchii TaxID=746691 RepID=A0ABQ5TIQ2_9BACI|nr:MULTISPECIES: chemotaxis protein CheC [Oceanobacillus]MBT2598687.1 chemotaxis protein CheC [Oceanobacillus sp. ISL-74]MBT2651606.1 chemotaxis protein CheC [Oceanobacillus sp. ISL-73]MCT1576255.1 chemotaxis protein CheC [Oceanobacillus kimchii]MCT2135892.1 chemotaxis protein CheC [Oceanobacillus kimchii]OEH54684.1 CheY-P-specific phosphatase CheC [Oceanobacillus sp. E9]
MSRKRLNEDQRDVLREIGNIGAGNAATALSQLLNQKIDMKVPKVNVVGFDEVMDLIGGPEQTIVGLMFRINGDIPGTVYVILQIEEAEYLVRKLTNNPDYSLFDNTENQEIAISALSEIGNILTGTYLSALSDFTTMNLQPSVPYLGIDMAGAILTVGLIEISHTSDYVIIIDTEMHQDDKQFEKISGKFLFIPDPESFHNLFTKLGIDYND